MAINTIKANNLSLKIDGLGSFLTADNASGIATLTVKNITGFAINQVLLIGEFGNEGSEIILTHTSTAPTGSTITLASNTVFPHSSSTPVYIINYNQVEFSTATTATGVKSVLATNAIQPDNENTYYNDSAGSTGYYFYRFKNSIGAGSYSAYSVAIPITGFGIATVRSIINSALSMIGKETSELLSDVFAFQEINNCQMEVLREYKRWSFMQVYDYSLGDLTTGLWKIALPTNCDDQFTNKTIWNFRIGTGDNLTYIDKQKWNEIIEGVAHTTLYASIIVGVATITLIDSSDFADSGSIYIGENTYTYTANIRTTGVLTLSAVSTTTNTAGEDVFQGGTLGTPRYWTIMAGYIYFYPILGTTLDNKNGWLDYYKAPVSITADTDSIVLPDPTCVQYYLAWKMLLRIQSGKNDAGSDAMYNNYIIRREKLKQKEVLGRTFSMKPLKNEIAVNDNWDSKQTRLGSFQT